MAATLPFNAPVAGDEAEFHETRNVAWRRFRRHRLAMAGAVVIAIMALVAIFANLIAPMNPDAIDRVVRKFAGKIGLDRGYSAHSMRATFITTALENGASLEDVQRAAGHREPGTTKLYDRRGYNPEKSASFFATY